MKDVQLAEKDRQIAALQEQQSELIKQGNQAQHLQALQAGSVKKLLDEGSHRKKGFFKRFRKDEE